MTVNAKLHSRTLIWNKLLCCTNKIINVFCAGKHWLITDQMTSFEPILFNDPPEQIIINKNKYSIIVLYHNRLITYKTPTYAVIVFFLSPCNRGRFFCSHVGGRRLRAIRPKRHGHTTPSVRVQVLQRFRLFARHRMVHWKKSKNLGISTGK